MSGGVHIRTRTLPSGEERFDVRYRRGGRGYRIEHAGTFRTIEDAQARRDLVNGQIAAGATDITFTASPDEGLSLGAAARIVREHAHLGGSRTWLYFIQQGNDGPVKIGIANDPVQRLRTLQAGNPERLRLISVYRCWAFEERQIHQDFADARLVGEWFRPTPALFEYARALDTPYVLEEMTG